jgi:hypothetical protein
MLLYAYVLQQGPAETTGYMIAGYSVIFVVLAIYLVSLYIRGQNLRRDQDMLEQMEKETQQ